MLEHASACYINMQVSPVWLCATLYLLCTSLGVMCAAGMLFQQQMLWALTGVSYVDALKLANAAPYSIRPIFAKRTLRQAIDANGSLAAEASHCR